MKVQAKAITFSELVFPRADIRVDMALVVGFSLITAIAARLAFYLPFSPVPITGQTFAVLLAGALLGSKRGALSQLVYLGGGALGLPVFANGMGGLPYMLGPTGGYLFGFVVSAFVVGFLAERGWDRRLWTSIIAMFLGSAAMYLFGISWLARFVPGEKVLVAGLLPFVPGDLFKIALVAAALPSGWLLVRKLQQKEG